jgi:hypothetical protein
MRTFRKEQTCSETLHSPLSEGSRVENHCPCAGGSLGVPMNALLWMNLGLNVIPSVFLVLLSSVLQSVIRK